MQVKLAKTAGFCYGVERAVETVYQEAEKGGRKIYTYGPIVHNDSVVRELEAQGVAVIQDLVMLKKMREQLSKESCAVIIRAHGVSKEVYKAISETGAEVIDATCPYVKKIHNIVEEHYRDGEAIIVTGTADHPEVQGILGQIGGDAVVIEQLSDAESFIPKENKRYCLVSQTTFNMQKFEDIVDILQKKKYDINVVKTICNATQLRQHEAMELSRECDAMIVIGGKHSSNTAKLYDICRQECRATYYIESLDDLTETIANSVRCVGITAGASTPKTIIEEVFNYVRDEF